MQYKIIADALRYAARLIENVYFKGVATAITWAATSNEAAPNSRYMANLLDILEGTITDLEAMR